MKRLVLISVMAMSLALTACGNEQAIGNAAAQVAEEETVETTISEEEVQVEAEEVVFEEKEFNTQDERFANQPEIDKQLWNEYNAGYSFDDALCVVNPYGQSPLSAIIFFETEDATKVNVTVQGKDEKTTITHDFADYSKKHSVPVYGLYPAEKNTVVVETVTQSGDTASKTFEIETEGLPTDISTAIIDVAASDKCTSGLTFFDCPHINGNYFFGIDLNGDIRWYLSDKTFNGCVMLTHLQNGNFLVGSGNTIPDTYNNIGEVFEVTPLGAFVREYDIYGIHHDIREKKNGNLIFAASEEGSEAQNDYIVEVDRNTGAVVNSWDLKEIVPMTEYDTQFPYSGGYSNWFHNNAIWYLEDEDAFVVSGRHQNTVMKFDAKTKEIKWILSETIGELNENVRPYLLTPVGDNFEYPTSQHAAMITPEGDLMLFDNRNQDVLDANEELIQDKLYSRAVRYSINEQDMTVEQVWEYGKEEGTKLYSSFISDVDYLGANHYLIDFGGQYIAEDGVTVYDHVHTAKDIKNASTRNSVVVEIDNDEVIWQVTLTGNSNSNTYKAQRKDIYQNAVEARMYDWK